MQSPPNGSILAALGAAEEDQDASPRVVCVGFLMFALLRDRIVIASLHDYAEAFPGLERPVSREPALGREAQSARRLLARVVEEPIYLHLIGSVDRRAMMHLVKIGLAEIVRGTLSATSEGIEEVTLWRSRP